MQRSSFFAANRAYLLSALILSLIIPLLKISASQVPVSLPSTLLNEWIDEGTGAFSNISAQSKASAGIFDWNLILPVAYLLISFFLFIRFSISLFRLYKAFWRSEVVRQNKMVVLVSNKQHLPFSFFRFVFLSRFDFENENNRLILIHEQAHLRCLHSIDLIVLEILQLLFWLNPMIIIYRRALRLQHEYQVDKIVLQKTNDYKGYLSSLARVVSNGLYARISNGFYCSTLKKRIQMIGNKTSKKISALQYLLIIPFTLIMILAFTRPETKKFLTILIPTHIIQAETHDTPSIVPIDEKKAERFSGYGYRIHPIFKIKMFHYGTDWNAPEGTEVFSTADGMVEKVENDQHGYGNMIIIRHGIMYSTRYAHLSAFAVKLGDNVKQGQVIGYVGSTGRAVVPHLHYEVLKNNKPVDPAKYFTPKQKRDSAIKAD